MSRKPFWALLVLLMVSSLLIYGCSGKESSDQSQPPAQNQQPVQMVDLKWPTGPAGSVMQVLGTAILEDMKKSININGSIMPGNVTANLMGISTGQYNIAFSTSDVTWDAWQGEGFFKEKGQIRNFSNVATLYPHMSQIVVRADSGINSIEDLKGKKVTPATKGLSNDIEMLRLLELYGMSADDLKIQYVNFNDAARQFNDGQVDCLFFTGLPVPHPSLINVGSTNDIKFLPVPEDKIKKMVETYGGLNSVVLPANTYEGQKDPVPGIGIAMHLVVSNDMPEEEVYNITKTIVENLAKYQETAVNMKFLKSPEDVAQDVGIPFHPGAKKYYQEKGWLK